jgi:hypothetical protein
MMPETSMAEIAAAVSTDKRKALAILDRYRSFYNNEIQGCCPLIADEIQRAIGGEVVAGELVFLGGNRRTHWWVEKDGVTFDPMGDWMFAPDDYMHREEAHRDRGIFERILPGYERWRVPESL